MTSILMAMAGAFAWSAGEYVLHRFVGHGPKLVPREGLLARLTPGGLAAEFNREHLAHHTDPYYFAPTSRKLMAAAAVIPVTAGVLAPLAGGSAALAFAVGFACAYGAYEVLHRRIHTHAPRGPFTRWMRRHHLLHHHKSPRANHGVTSPVWDVVFGTLTPLERVRVPRRHAPPWLVDARGEVRAEYGDDYELVGRGGTGCAPAPGEELVAVL